MKPEVQIDSVAGVLFNQDRTQVLLIQRRDVPVWALPGGGIELNETPVQAVEREILEETGLTVKACRVVGTYIPLNRLARPTLLYECFFISGSPSLSTETRGIAFFPMNDLPALLPPPYQEWIEDAYLNIAPIEKKLTSVTYRALISYFFLHPILVSRFLLARLGFAINTKSR